MGRKTSGLDKFVLARGVYLSLSRSGRLGFRRHREYLVSRSSSVRSSDPRLPPLRLGETIKPVSSFKTYVPRIPFRVQRKLSWITGTSVGRKGS